MITSFLQYLKEDDSAEVKKQKKILSGRWSNIDQRLAAAKFLLNKKKSSLKEADDYSEAEIDSHLLPDLIKQVKFYTNLHDWDSAFMLVAYFVGDKDAEGVLNKNANRSTMSRTNNALLNNTRRSLKNRFVSKYGQKPWVDMGLADPASERVTESVLKESFGGWIGPTKAIKVASQSDQSKLVNFCKANKVQYELEYSGGGYKFIFRARDYDDLHKILKTIGWSLIDED